MIKEYGLYNNHELDNTLLVKFSDETITKSVSLSEEMEVIYSGDKVAAYKIRNFIRYAKIKYSGIIFLPIDPLIDVINSVFAKYKLENLDYKRSSGYITKLDNDVLRVFALKGTFLRDGDISKGRYCSYYDLYINNEKELIEIKENVMENIDFFKMEAKIVC